MAATEGRIQRQAKAKRFGEIVTDSSKVKRSSVFVALKGERFDGHRFVKDAVSRGAACVVVHQSVRRSDCQDAAVIKVPDTLRALGDLAHYRREKYAPRVLAITGSNGKTTTKEMLSAILQQASLDGTRLHGKVLKTAGNFNNLVGLPLTLLRLNKKHRVAVVEMGTNRPGEIKRLAEVAAPDLGIITSVAAAHLEGLKSLAGVAKEKGALFQGMRRTGTIAVNLDDPWVARLADNFHGRKITYGRRGNVRAESDVTFDVEGMRFTLRVGAQRCRVRLHFIGEHNIVNAVGAAAMAHGLGVGLTAIRRGLESVKPYQMRMQVESWRGIGIINDAYNANPASMNAAVSTLANMGTSGERIAVLGDMFELGKQSQRRHLQFGAHLASARIDRVYLLGEHATDVQKGALRGGMKADRVIIGKNYAEVAGRLRSHMKKGDWLLFKGSRGMKMETIVRRLKGQERGE
ncbi:MAG: UDP-N-acetylmuramoyl-tripeptide--D-alanyl-D-alanine ligase [Candidatus Binatia bacterium]